MTTTQTCIECRSEFTPKKAHARFCGTACRKQFNNRRAVRGAVLYDAFMALRYERGWAKTVGLWQLLCRLVSEWRAEDEELGRASYIRPDEWVADNAAWLRSKQFAIKVGRAGR